MTESPPELSVIICTYNRANLLARCLDSFVDQTLDSQRFELIVVNNRSTDDTSAVLEQFRIKIKNLQVFWEENAGLSYARNRGIRESRGALIAFIDDDARASSNWCQEIISFFSNHKDAAAVGGPYTAYYDSPRPEWFLDRYGSWNLGEGLKIMGNDEYVNGTNMIFRKFIFEKIGLFNTGIGMKGSKISFGEETNLHRRMNAAGYTVYYAPSIVVSHLVRAEKMNLFWLLKTRYAGGRSESLIFQRKTSSLKLLILVIFQFFSSIGEFFNSGEKYFRSRFADAAGNFIYRFGVFIASLTREKD